MIISWQDIFYFLASLAMVAIFIASIWLMWMLFVASKIIKNFMAMTHKWCNVVDDIRYFKKNIKLNIVSFLLKILDKGDKNERS